MARRAGVGLSAAAAAALVAGCTTSTAPARGTVTISVVSGAGQTDTIDTPLPTPLVVHAAGGTPGQAVHFSSAFRPGGFAEALVGSAQDEMDTAYDAPLDASLNAVAFVQLGDIADSASIGIVSQGASRPATATFLVTHGNSVALTGTDTAVYIGTTGTVHATLVDRHKNPIATQASYTLVSGPAALASTTITSNAFGVADVLATASKFADTIHVSMVPHGTLAAASDSLGVVVFDLDGSGFRALTRMQATFIQWMPSGNAVLFDRSLYVYTEGSHHGGIFIVDTAGTVTSPDSARPDSIADYEPQISYDGAWIYYLAFDPSFNSWLRRMHPDGTGVESIDSTTPSFPVEYPATSAGDTLLTFDNGNIFIRRVGSAAPRESLTVGSSARWSPTAPTVAFIGPLKNESAVFGPVEVLTLGGAPRQIGSAIERYDPNPQWSPDGRYIIARVFLGRIEVIDVTSGVNVPLPYTGALAFPAWRPSPPGPAPARVRQPSLARQRARPRHR